VRSAGAQREGAPREGAPRERRAARALAFFIFLMAVTSPV